MDLLLNYPSLLIQIAKQANKYQFPFVTLLYISEAWYYNLAWINMEMLFLLSSGI